MKKIKKDEITDMLSEKMIKILGFMANEFPPSNEWREISKILNNEQRRLVNDEICKIQEKESRKKWNALSKEQQDDELVKRKISINSRNFSGNMGEPE